MSTFSIICLSLFGLFVLLGIITAYQVTTSGEDDMTSQIYMCITALTFIACLGYLIIGSIIHEIVADKHAENEQLSSQLEIVNTSKDVMTYTIKVDTLLKDCIKVITLKPNQTEVFRCRGGGFKVIDSCKSSEYKNNNEYSIYVSEVNN